MNNKDTAFMMERGQDLIGGVDAVSIHFNDAVQIFHALWNDNLTSNQENEKAFEAVRKHLVNVTQRQNKKLENWSQFYQTHFANLQPKLQNVKEQVSSIDLPKPINKGIKKPREQGFSQSMCQKIAQMTTIIKPPSLHENLPLLSNQKKLEPDSLLIRNANQLNRSINSKTVQNQVNRYQKPPALQKTAAATTTRKRTTINTDKATNEMNKKTTTTKKKDYVTVGSMIMIKDSPVNMITDNHDHESLQQRTSSSQNSLILQRRRHGSVRGPSSSLLAIKGKNSQHNCSPQTTPYELYLELKECESCSKPGNDHELLLCDYCDDSYHMSCLKPPLQSIPSSDWICPPCKFVVIPTTTTNPPKKNTSDLSSGCAGCKQHFNISQCTRCEQFFHLSCLAKTDTETSARICPPCNKIIQDTVTSSESLLKFFSSSNNSAKTEEEQEEGEEEEEKIICETTSRYKFKVPIPISSPERLLNQKMLLATALLSRNLTFDDNLCYLNPYCPAEFNRANLEKYLEPLDSANFEAFKEFKKLSEAGNYAPLNVINDPKQGYVVQAADSIPKFTLLSEYVGDVDFLRKRLFDPNDSIMELLRTPHSTSCLVICPESKGNIARFISGINNSNPNAYSKINVASLRFNIGGKARVLLYAKKNIKCGQILYYDYNAGGNDAYPTNNFV